MGSVPVIPITEIIHEQELRRRIEKARYWGHVDSPSLDSNWFVTTGMFDERQFFLFEDGLSYAEALGRMVARLTEDGLVDEGFRERLEQRERRGLMAFGGAVALPHCIQRAKERCVLAVGIFERPVRYGGNDVSIIFLLGLPERIEDNDYLLMRIYDEIITISQDAELREKVAAARSYQELRSAMFKSIG